MKTKWILITGAFGTIGSALRTQLEGYHILAHDYKGRGDVAGDFSEEKGSQQCVLEVLQKTETLYAIIHTVGDFYEAPLSTTASHVWTELFQNNVISAAHLARELKPEVFISFGVAGLLQPAKLMPAYLATKCALASFTKSLSLTGVRAHMVCPGSVEGAEFAQKGPLVKCAEIVDLVELLLRSTAMTGQIIDIAHGIR